MKTMSFGKGRPEKEKRGAVPGGRALKGAVLAAALSVAAACAAMAAQGPGEKAAGTGAVVTGAPGSEETGTQTAGGAAQTAGSTAQTAGSAAQTAGSWISLENLSYDVSAFQVPAGARTLVVVEGFAVKGGRETYNEENVADEGRHNKARVTAFTRGTDTDPWTAVVQSSAVMGWAGMSNDRHEGDGTTPIGFFKLDTPFGRRPALQGFPADYQEIMVSRKNQFWSDNTNRLETSDNASAQSGERLYEDWASGIYSYCLNTGFNSAYVKGVGSAIFLHCTKPGKPSTAGCIAMDENAMTAILRLYARGDSYVAMAPEGTFGAVYGAYSAGGVSPAGSFPASAHDMPATPTVILDGSAQTAVSGTTAAVSQDSAGTAGAQAASGTSQGVTAEAAGLNSGWKYAGFSKINSGTATLYRNNGGAHAGTVVCVNAGHGTKGGTSVKTQSHPDGTGKVTGGTNAKGAVMSAAVSTGMDFADGTPEYKVTLAAAKLLKEKLLARGYSVLMIREEDDVQLDNIARTVMANNLADCHVALHWDSSTSDKGAFYMSVPDALKYMEPVASTWQKSEAFGDAVIEGLKGKGVKIFGSGRMDMDLTQTSYSTIPSIDIELGDKVSDHSAAKLDVLAEGMADGIDRFFR